MLPRAGFLYALAAAFLFGAGAPLSKIFLQEIDPWILAGILYLGAGLALLVLFLVRRLCRRPSNDASLFRTKNLVWLAGSTFFGGIVAPVLLMKGLARMEGTTASLFLNVEMVFTVAIAGLVFKEILGGRFIAGMIAILAGSILLSWTGKTGLPSILGPLFVTGACLAWGIDNNFTREISDQDPLQIGAIKCLVAGGANITLSLEFHDKLPGVLVCGLAGLVGVFSYGISLACFILALRQIGASRTSAYFSLAPFFGAGLSVVLLGDPLTTRLLAAGFLMGLGAWICATEGTRCP